MCPSGHLGGDVLAVPVSSVLLAFFMAATKCLAKGGIFLVCCCNKYRGPKQPGEGEVYLAYSSRVAVHQGKSGQELGTGTGAEAMEERRLPACSPGSQSGTFLVSVKSTVHSELGLATSTIHHENAPIDLPTGNVTVEVSSSEERVLYSSCWKRRVLAQEREWMVT